MDAAGLRADCARCSGLCCVALPFARSADFAIDKAAGTPCRHLQLEDRRCGIHSALRERGFRGCAAFDCFGAGQRVTRLVSDGQTWRSGDASTVFAAFDVVRALHEVLWYLDELVTRVPARLRDVVSEAIGRTERLAGLPLRDLVGVDLAAHRASVAPALRAASAAVRRGGRHRFGPSADLAGRRLAGADLSDEDLRGASLIAADLAHATLHRTDLLGADLRDANLAGADLGDALFVTAGQVGAASGDGATRLPPRVPRPAHWADRSPTGATE